MIKNLTIIFITLTISLCGSSQDSQQKHHFYCGLNVATPFGFYTTKPYHRPLSFVSSNPCISVFGEYRYSFLGIQIPVRIPLSHLTIDDVKPEVSQDFGYIQNGIWDVRYEFGIKPILYFKPFDNQVQVYGGVAYYYGSRYGFDVDTYNYFNLKPSTGIYEEYAYQEHVYIKTNAMQYQRTTLFAGTKFQFINGLGFSFDCDVFYSYIRGQFGEYYSNEGTTSGEMMLRDVGNTDVYKDMGVQFNAHVFYRFK